MIAPIATSLAASAYDRARASIAPQPGQGSAQAGSIPGIPTGGERFMKALDAVDGAATGALTGTSSVQSLVQTVAEAEMTLETVVAIRDKVVEAYQEILRMPV